MGATVYLATDGGDTIWSIGDTEDGTRREALEIMRGMMAEMDEMDEMDEAEAKLVIKHVVLTDRRPERLGRVEYESGSCGQLTDLEGRPYQYAVAAASAYSPSDILTALREMLEPHGDANGYLSATVGTNGSGGAWVVSGEGQWDDELILEMIGDPSDWSRESTDADELARHLFDAGLDVDDYDAGLTTTWRRQEVDDAGYLTGSEELIYTI